jgi:hypothetical protein
LQRTTFFELAVYICLNIAASIRASKGKDSLEGLSLPENVEHAVISPLIESLPTKFGSHTVVSICAILTPLRRGSISIPYENFTYGNSHVKMPFHM